MNNEPARSWLVIVGTSALMLVAFASVLLISWRAVRGWSLQPATPRELGILAALLLLVGCVLGYLLWMLLVQLFTRFDAKGIRQPHFPSSVFMLWRDVTEVIVDAVRVEIRSPDKVVQIRLYGFRHPDELVDLIRRRVPAHVRVDAR